MDFARHIELYMNPIEIQYWVKFIVMPDIHNVIYIYAQIIGVQSCEKCKLGLSRCGSTAALQCVDLYKNVNLRRGLLIYQCVQWLISVGIHVEMPVTRTTCYFGNPL